MCDSRGLSALSRLTSRASEPRFGSILAWANRQKKNGGLFSGKSTETEDS
jgi:hypothetical protein